MANNNILFAKTTPPPALVALPSNTQFVVLELDILGPGALEIPGPANYVIFGRVVIRNNDGDPQDAHAWLTVGGSRTYLDEVDTRIAGNSSGTSTVESRQGGQSISLQGHLTVAATVKTARVFLSCQTYDGYATNISLFAISVDGIVTP
jgi:hypothetical protein